MDECSTSPDVPQTSPTVYSSVSITRVDNGYLVSANCNDYSKNRNAIAFDLDAAFAEMKTYLA
jgi:hypothetical protein